MYKYAAAHLAKANGNCLSLFVDAGVSLGLAAISENEWWMYCELFFDAVTWSILTEVCPSCLGRFAHHEERIRNVTALVGGRDTMKGAYYETREEVWNADYSQWPNLVDAMKSYGEQGGSFENKLVPELAPAANRLVLASVEVADLLFMGKECQPTDFDTRPARRLAATPDFIDAMAALMKQVAKLPK